MVSWYQDGDVNGFVRDGTHAVQLQSAYKLVTNGSVDVQAVTRVQVGISNGQGLNNVGSSQRYYNGIEAKAYLTFTSTDVNNYIGFNNWYFNASMFVAPASLFPDNYVPTPTEIYALGSSLQVSRGNLARRSAGNIDTNMLGPSYANLSPNTKYWMMVTPTLIKDTNSTPSASNDLPFGNMLTTMARAISFWTNRTPAAPTVTSPLNGTVVDGGNTLTLSFDSNDPDRVLGSPGDDKPFVFDDLAGVQVQYAAVGTTDWTDLPFVLQDKDGLSEGPGWFIENSSALPGPDTRVNQIPNPSFESNTTSWSATESGTTLIRDTSKAQVGAASLRISQASGTFAGAQITVNNLVSGRNYTLSLYANASSSLTAKATFGQAPQGSVAFPAAVSGDIAMTGAWVRIADLTITAGRTDGVATVGVTFKAPGPGSLAGNIDAVLVEQADSSGDYFDGSTADTSDWDYSWDGTANNSTSKAVDPDFANAAEDFRDNKTITVRCGSNTLHLGEAALPSGNWQLRMRTFDYGHPYRVLKASDGSFVDGYGPMGTVLPNSPSGSSGPSRNFTPSTYSASGISPWSSVVTVTVTAQVPQPVIVSPTNAIALVEGQPVDLTWLYRNSATPPYPQYKRSIRIRKVGDTDWDNIEVDQVSDSNVYTIAQNTTTRDDYEYLIDRGFEMGSTGRWDQSTDNPGSTITNVTGTAGDGVHTGTHALDVLGGAGVIAATEIVVPLRDQDEVFNFSAWLKDVSAFPFTVYSNIDWLDASSSVISSSGNSPSSTGDWQNDVAMALLNKPSGAVSARISLGVQALGNPGHLAADDVSFEAVAYAANYPLVSGNEYEWQVQVTDLDGVVSNWSSTGRFWVVPAPGSGGTRPLPGETVDGATLGCGTHRVEIYRRGGQVKVGEISNLSSVKWGRLRDDISTATVEVSGWGVDCGNLLALLQTWAYEMVIWRDNGYSVDRVWEGPITLLTYEVDKVTIDAKDVMGYAYRRILKQQMDDSSASSPTRGDTVVRRAARILQNVFAPDDPNLLAYLTLLTREDDATEYRSTPAYSRTAYEEIDDMAANAGLDYTAVGRSILLWGTKHRIGLLPEFRDEDLGAPPIVSEYGMSFANRYAVSDGNGVYGEATRLDNNGQDTTYGLVEMLSSSWASDSDEDTGTYTQEGLQSVIESFEGYAERSIEDRYPPPVVVRIPDNTSLSPDAVISIQQLVPGVAIPLRSTGTLRPVVGTQKLDSISVTEENGKETITIVVSPFNQDDADAGDDTGDA